ncbi:hypothetical protein CNR22_21450 [Sphingobacteriaceae bacterium]|nr:hypothetical protein CNR22_21450 [Sphingobacteriaceae bacterium]
MKKILIPYDFTENSETSLNYGINLAKELHSEIVLVNVISYPLVTPEIGLPAFSYKDVIADSLKELRKLATKIAQNNSHLTKIECFAEMGDITQTLAEYCEKHPIEFIIMGISHQDNKLLKALMGSNALETSRKTRCTVIVVPHAFAYKKPKAIAFASDHSDVNSPDPSLQKAKAISNLFGAELEIIQVVGENHHFAPSEFVVNHFFDKTHEKQEHKLVIVTEKKVSEGLLGMLNNNLVDMMIVEPKEHSVVYNLFHESVSKEVAFASPVPVILMHS